MKIIRMNIKLAANPVTAMMSNYTDVRRRIDAILSTNAYSQT